MVSAMTVYVTELLKYNNDNGLIDHNSKWHV